MVEIRRLSKNDNLSDLLMLSRAFFGEYESHHEEFFNIGDLRDSQIESYFMRFVGADDAVVYVARDGSLDIGYITALVKEQAAFYRVRRIGAISGLMVDRRFRRRGIGSELLRKAMAFFRWSGVRYYTLYTSAANEGALNFYRALGMSDLQTVLVGRV